MRRELAHGLISGRARCRFSSLTVFALFAERVVPLRVLSPGDVGIERRVLTMPMDFQDSRGPSCPFDGPLSLSG
jgi:hypothetical protein